MAWICMETADSTASSKRLNSSKQPHAPHFTRPTKILPIDFTSMPWKEHFFEKKNPNEQTCTQHTQRVDQFHATMKINVLHLITVEDQNLTSEQAAQGFDRLGLAGASRPVRVSPEPHLHGLGQSQIALVSQGGVHQLGRVPLTGSSSGGGGQQQGRREHRRTQTERQK